MSVVKAVIANFLHSEFNFHVQDSTLLQLYIYFCAIVCFDNAKVFITEEKCKKLYSSTSANNNRH